MVEEYGLREVWIPEDKDLDEEYHHLPKCNIFMSEEFYNPNSAHNANTKALVLI